MSFKNKYIGLFFIISIVVCSTSCRSSGYQSVTFDDIRENGGFASKYLQNISRIDVSGDMLIADEKEALIRSEYLINIHTLNLRSQDLNDDFVARLACNTSLKRLINIDLSDNRDLTIESLKSLLNSVEIGSIRDLPQISGSLGLPSSTIYLKAYNTSIEDPDGGDDHFNQHIKNFSIKYENPVTGVETDSAVDYGVKFVECQMW